MMQQMAASNTILQTIAADDKRGRVMSFYTLAILGMNPIGSLLAGAVAARIGVPATMIWAGAICLAGAAWFYWKLPEIRRVIRPIYPGARHPAPGGSRDRASCVADAARGLGRSFEGRSPPQQEEVAAAKRAAVGR